MKQSVHENFSQQYQLSSAAGIKSLVSKTLVFLIGVITSFTCSAQTYTTKADGNWSSAATWVGGLVPSSTIAAGKTVNIKHKITYDNNSDLQISGTLNVIGDTLQFPTNFNKDVKLNSGSVLTITNGAMLETVANHNSNITLDRARMVLSNAKFAIAKDFTVSQGGSMSFVNSTLSIGGKYDISGSLLYPTIDTVQASLIETAISASGDFHLKGTTTFRVSNAYIKVDNNNNFKSDALCTISVLPGASSNYGFDLLKVSKDLQNDGAWVARIDAACIGGNINGLQMGAIDMTRAEDCSNTPSIGAAPELTFKNPVLKSGVANKQGAIYRFANVATGIDAEVRLKKFSRSDIVMQDIDLANLGWDKAFQPQFGLAGLVQPNQNWYIDFEMIFYLTGTNTVVTLPKVDMTALDVDGDGVSISEYAVFENPSNVIYSSINYLVDQPAGILGQSLTCPVCGLLSPLIACPLCGGDGKTGTWNLTDCPLCNATGLLFTLCNHPFDGVNGNILQGPVDNFANIDTAATQVMATYQYTDRSVIDFRYGAKSGSLSSNGAGIRLNSLWFRQFSLNTINVLPVKLQNFAATLDRKDVNLSWTASEENFSHYVIQRSTDGKNFSDIALVFTDGVTSESHSYKFRDANVASNSSLLFYRLKLVDNTEEAEKYSEVRTIKIGKESNALQISAFPNPANDLVKVTLPTSWQGKPVMIELINGNGARIQATQIFNASQTEGMQLNGIAKGFYVIKASCNGEVAQQTIIKN